MHVSFLIYMIFDREWTFVIDIRFIIMYLKGYFVSNWKSSIRSLFLLMMVTDTPEGLP